RATVERLEMREQLSLDLAGLAEPFSKRLRIDSLAVSGDSVALFVDPATDEAFYREADIRLIEKVADSSLAPYGKVSSRLRVRDRPLSDLIPNHYRDPEERDPTRLPTTVYSGQPVVSYPDRPDRPGAGLYGRHIALWPSHGLYYEPTLDRWEW